MATIDIDFLRRLRDSWYAEWSGNIQRAHIAQEFLNGSQFDAIVKVTDRNGGVVERKEEELLKEAKIEPLIMNQVREKSDNLLAMIRGQKFDLQLLINGREDGPGDELSAQLKEILFSQDTDIEYSEALELAITHGFSAIYIGWGYDDEAVEDPELYIKIKTLDDPERFFFDPRAKEVHKGDGSFCGIRHTLLKTNMEKYGQDKLEQINFFDEEGIPYAELTDLYLKKDRKIFFYRFSDEVILESRELINIEYLPMVFHGGSSKKIKGREVTQPLSQRARSPQRLYNFAFSIALYYARNYQHSYLMPSSSVIYGDEKQYGDMTQLLKRYAVAEGVTPIVIPPTEAPATIPLMIAEAQGLINQIYSDRDALIRDSKYSSDKALNTKMQNSNIGGVSTYYTAHRVALNRIGKILLSLIPYQMSNSEDYIQQLLDYGRRANVEIKMSLPLEQQKARDNELILNMIQYLGNSGLKSEQLSIELMAQVLENIDTCEAKNLRKRLLEIGERAEIEQQNQNAKPSPEEIKLLEIQTKVETADKKLQGDLMEAMLKLTELLERNKHEEEMLDKKIRNDQS